MRLEDLGNDKKLDEVSLGDYRTKAAKQKALSQMGAMFGRDAEQKAKDLDTYRRREAGLNRVKNRDEAARQAAQKKQMDDNIARLPELRAEYEDMKKKYKSLGGSNWQYADREQNLTDYERKARDMEGPMNNLWRTIQAAERAQREQGVNEMDSQGYRGSRYDDEANQGEEGIGQVAKPADVVKHGADILNRAMDKSRQVQDRKTGKWYDPDEEFDKLKNSPDFMGVMKRVSTREGAEAEKNPHTSALGKALYRDLSKEKKASPAQQQRNALRWAQRQKAKAEQPPTKGMSNAEKVDKGWRNPNLKESNTIDFIRGLISEFNTQMSGSPYYPMDYKNPGMRMWTRGDGSRYKDPGYIFIERDLKPEDQPKWHKAKAVEKFWKFLESKGARKIGDVSGEFGSDPHSPAVVLNKQVFVFNGRSIAWGSTGRLKNSSVWRQKQQGVAEEANTSHQHHVVSKLDGNVLASYKTKQEAHKNAHGNPVVSGSLETIGDKQYVKEQGVAEGSEERSQNRLWQMITDYEQRAKATKNDIKKAHYIKMASELRGKLKTSDEQDVRDALDNGDDYTAKQYAKMAPTPDAKKYLLNIIKQAMYIDDLGGETDWKGVAEASRQTDDPFDDMVEDYLDYLDSIGELRKDREQEKSDLIADLEAGYVHPSEIEYALSGTKWDPLGEASVTDYNPKSQGGTRKELLAKYTETGDNDYLTRARRAGASQSELQAALNSRKGTSAIRQAMEAVDADQRRAKQVPAEEMPKKTSPVLGKKEKQHPFKGRAVGGQ